MAMNIFQKSDEFDAWRPLHNPHPVIARRLCAVAISLIMVIYEIASSAVASSQRQKQMLCKGLAWLVGLKDHVGKAQIALRLDRAAKGNFGDCESVGEGVSEMRIHYGPGYRVYFTRRDSVVYLLLLGGDKSTQKRDIKHAIEMARILSKE